MHLVGGGRDVLQQFQLLLPVVKVAQSFFGDGFGFQPGGALAFQPAPQPGDLHGLFASLFAHHQWAVIRNWQLSSPRCMQSGCSTVMVWP